MNKPLENLRKIDLDGEVITLDPNRLCFNDTSLSKFMEELSIWYDYFSSKGAKAEELMTKFEAAYEEKKAEKILLGSQNGLSVKAAESFATIDTEVKALLESFNYYKSATKQMKEFLKSLDKAHGMAQNRGYMIRKEMDKLQTDIYHTSGEFKDIQDIIGTEP